MAESKENIEVYQESNREPPLVFLCIPMDTGLWASLQERRENGDEDQP